MEKVDSVIVVPVRMGKIYTAKPTFRVGINRSTLDLPGGRLPDGFSPNELVPSLLERELGVPNSAINIITNLDNEKWSINSAFSKQGLWGVVAEIDESFEIQHTYIGEVVDADAVGVSLLLEKIDCLQCRAVLLEWVNQRLSLNIC